MATKFGYVERQATQVDWSAVGKQFTDVIKEESRIRQEKKAAIDEASREMANILQNAPTGDNQTANEFTLNYANDAQALLLQQDRLLKAGILNPKDYQVVRANLNDSTDQLFKLGKEYQDEYKEKMDRWEGDISSFYEVWEMEQAEGLANIKNGKALINPNSGVVSIGMWEDGKMDGEPGSFATVNQLRMRLKQKTDRFNTTDAVTNAVKTLGGNQWVEVFQANGGGKLDQVLTTMDKKQRADYETWENNTVQAMLGNERDKASILLDTEVNAPNGKRYTLTYNKDEQDENTIYINTENNPAGIPEFTDEQEEVIDKALRERLRAQLETKETMTVSRKPYAPQPNPSLLEYQRKLNESENEQKQAVNMMEYAYSGDENQIAASETYFKDALGAKDVTRTETEMIIIDQQGNKSTIPLGTKEIVTLTQAMIDADPVLYKDNKVGDKVDGVFVPYTREEFFQTAGPKLAGNMDISKALELAGNGEYAKVTVTQEMIDADPVKYQNNEVGDVVMKGYSDITGTGAFDQVPLSPTQQEEFRDNEMRNYVQGIVTPSLFKKDDSEAVTPISNVVSQFGATVRYESGVFGDYSDGVYVKLGDKEEFFATGDGLEGGITSSSEAKRLQDWLFRNVSPEKMLSVYENQVSKGVVNPIPQYAPREGGATKFN